METELTEIKEVIARYKTREISSWLDLATIIERKRKEGETIPFFLSLGVSEKTYRILLRAYRFLSVRRLLDKPIKAGAEVVALLPAAYRRLSMSENEFDKLVMDVLAGKIGTKTLSKLSRGIIERAKPKIDGELLRKSFCVFNFIRQHLIDTLGVSEGNKMIMRAYGDKELLNIDQAFGFSLEILEAFAGHTLTRARSVEGARKELEKLFGNQCHDVAIELECIASKDFDEAQDEKERFTL